MKIVIFGSGNIGRGFIGQVFSDAGYDVVFVDIDTAVVDEINRQGEYPLILLTAEGEDTRIIDSVRAVDANDSNVVVSELVSADIAATAVGLGALPYLAPNIAKAVKARIANGTNPLDILICENAPAAHTVLKAAVEEVSEPGFVEKIAQNIGFVRTTIGRMVPVTPSDLLENNKLTILAEGYNKIPADADAFLNESPDVPEIKPFSPFEYELKKKLYLHNLGHGVVGYFGSLAGHEFIWQAMTDENIRVAARTAMLEAAAAIDKVYGETDLPEHIEELLLRFSSPALRDTVERICRDPMRKLAPGDRFSGAACFCAENDVAHRGILKSISAALKYKDEKLQTTLKEKGVISFLLDYCKLNESDAKTVLLLLHQIVASRDGYFRPNLR